MPTGAGDSLDAAENGVLQDSAVIDTTVVHGGGAGAAIKLNGGRAAPARAAETAPA